MNYYVVKYEGEFAYIKPWTAVRDGLTYSQQFLTPSIIEGLEKKIFPETISNKGSITKIIRHKLSYSSIDIQQEKTQSRGWDCKQKSKTMTRTQAVIDRGILLKPILSLAFINEADAKRASQQHICLCRNEDIMLPESEIKTMTELEFNALKGFELRFTNNEDEDSFLVGYNRFNNKPMYGWLEIDGDSTLGNE